MKGHDLFFGLEHVFKNDRIPSNWNAWGYEEKPTPIPGENGHGRVN